MRAKIFAAALSAVTLVSGVANAALISVTTAPIRIQTAIGISTSSTTGATMDGVKVTAKFQDGSSDVGIWGGTGGTSGAAFGGGGLFSLTLPNNTYFAKWNLTNNHSSLLTSLLINAGAGTTVFDIVSSPIITPGSSGGRAFTDASPAVTGDIAVRYLHPVQVTPNAPLGDLYAIMFVNFSGLDIGGLGTNASYKFVSDTDHLDPPVLIGTPVPAALPLMLAGIGGLVWMGRRKA